MEHPAAIDRFIEEIEGEGNRKVSEALAKARQAVQDRHNKQQEQIMENTTVTPSATPAVTPKPATPKPASKPKAAAPAAKPAKKAAKPAKKAAPKAKAKVKTHSAHMGRQVKYTKELIMELVKQAKSNGKSLKAVVAGRKALKYVPLLVAAKKLHGLDLWHLMNGTTFHKNGKRA